MTRVVRWGVLGVAGIAVRKVIPAMQLGETSRVTAIASRDLAKARDAAAKLGIPHAYGSYEELLADPQIDAIYNPLPNHLHVPWSILALQAGKHVLCEKPLGMNCDEVRAMIRARDAAGRLAGEAFMVRTHPQWIRVKEIVDSGEIGEMKAITGWFSYFNRDPENVRNVPAYGGGGLMDIGCYPIFISRFLFGSEPLRASGVLEMDPTFGTDRLTSAVMEFRGGQSTFVCSTQLSLAQRVIVLGTKARIEVEIPYNAPTDRGCRILVDTGSDLYGGGRREEILPLCDQYTIQGELFSRAILGEGSVPVPLEDSLGNMAVIAAIERSSSSGRWESLS